MKHSALLAVCATWCLYWVSASAEDTKKVKASLCKLSPEEGECGQFHQRWYYNEKTNECYQFMYRGCNGNENNFRDKDECLDTCGDQAVKEQTLPVEKTEELAEASGDVSSSLEENNAEEPVFGEEGEDEEGVTEEEEDEEAEEVLEDAFSKGILNKDGISTGDMSVLKQLVSDLSVYELQEMDPEDGEEDDEAEDGGDYEYEYEYEDEDAEDGDAEEEKKEQESEVTEEQHLDSVHDDADDVAVEDDDDELYDDEDYDVDEDGEEDDMSDPLDLLDQAQKIGLFDQNAMTDEDRNALVSIMMRGTTYLNKDGKILKASDLPVAEIEEEEEEAENDFVPEEETTQEKTSTEEVSSSTDEEPVYGTDDEDDEEEAEEEDEEKEVEDIFQSAEQKGLLDRRIMSDDDRKTLAGLMATLDVFELLPMDETDEADGEEEGEGDGDDEEGIVDQEDYEDMTETEGESMDPFDTVLEEKLVTTPPPIYENEDDNEGRPVPPMCFFKADSGPCKAKRRQWFYDFGRQRCMPFFYGGCLGNANRFRSEAHCMGKCLGVGVQTLRGPQPPPPSFKMGPTMKVLEKLGPFKKIPTFLSLFAKPLMNGGNVRITLPHRGQPQGRPVPPPMMRGPMKPELRHLAPPAPSMQRIVPLPPPTRQQQQQQQQQRQQTQRLPVIMPPSKMAPPVPFKQAPPMNEIVPKPMPANPLTKKYPMLKVMFYKKHSPKQFLSPSVSRSNTLYSDHQDNRYQTHSTPKNGLSLTQIFVNKPSTTAQANPSDMTFNNKGRMDRKNSWMDREDRRDMRQGRHVDRRMRGEWEDRKMGRQDRRMREDWDDRQMDRRMQPSEYHHYHHYSPPMPLPQQKPVVFMPPMQQPPMMWHPPVRQVLPPPNRGPGQFLLQLIAQKRSQFGGQGSVETSTANSAQQWNRYNVADEEETGEVSEERKPSYACLLPVNSGRCKALEKKWYFNKEKGACETFFYGGCGGNANNFNTPEDCRDACLEYIHAEQADQKVREEVISIQQGEEEEEEETERQGEVETTTIMVQEEFQDSEEDEGVRPVEESVVEEVLEEKRLELEDKHRNLKHTISVDNGPHYTILLIVVSVVGVIVLLLLVVVIVYVLRRSRDTKKEKVLEAVVRSNLYSDLPKFVYAPPPPTPPTPTKERINEA